MPRETPTPIPIFRPLLSVAVGALEDGGFVEVAVVVLGMKFQPFRWMPVITVALGAVDIDVTHAFVTTPSDPVLVFARWGKNREVLVWC